MKRFKCIVAYDGTHFNGFQIQQNQRTVQGEIQKALKKVHKGEEIIIQASGRTDTNVHANGQAIHFDTTLSLTSEQWKRALNTQLPQDIFIKKVEEVSEDFHARYNVERKEYRYRIWNQKDEDVFGRYYHYHYPYQLNIERMKEALQHFVGTFDFTSFCSAKTEKENKVRTIYSATLVEVEQEIVISLVGSGFLHNMVRIIIGTLIEIGNGRRDIHSIEQALKGANRKLAGKTAPPHGLILWEVNYNN